MRPPDFAGHGADFNVYYMVKEDTDLLAMLTCTASDTLGRTVGGTTGKFAGAAAGAVFFGPAGRNRDWSSWCGRRSHRRQTLDRNGERVASGRGRRSCSQGSCRVAQASAEAIPEKLEAWSKKSELLARRVSPGPVQISRKYNAS